MTQPSQEHMEKHYHDLKDREFFPHLIKFAVSGPVIAMVWEGNDIIKTARKMIGATKGEDRQPGTIRGDFNIGTRKNNIHGSDCLESA